MLNWQEVDAVIFDMDGTLVDSMQYWHDLPANLFRQNNVPVPQDLDLILAAADLWQAAELFAQRFIPNRTTQQIFDQLQQEMDEHYAQDIPLLPGVAQLLAALKQTGRKMCIATMTDRPQVQTMLHTHHLEGYFNFLLTTPEVGCGKNQPDIFLQACQRFGLPKERVAVFEDSRTAAKTVLQLGMPLVFIGNDNSLQALANQHKASLTMLQGYADLPLPQN